MRIAKSQITKTQVYVILAAALLMAGYVAWSIGRPAVLAFRDRLYPAGFRELILEGASSPLDLNFALQPMPRSAIAPKPELPALCEALFRDPASPTVGRPDSPMAIAAFLDYRCPYCKTLNGILSGLQTESVRIIYKDWPILGESSVLGARAALAADRQGHYLSFHNRLMNSRFVPAGRFVEDIAVELGLNRAQWRSDMTSQATTLAIERTAALASALGFIGTPALVVGHTVVQGEITRRQLERLIADERQPRGKVC
jgi:protein-disulfide isomerase